MEGFFLLGWKSMRTKRNKNGRENYMNDILTTFYLLIRVVALVLFS
jgi:hypothetical protein